MNDMKCPSQNSENSGVLVDYCAQKLSAAAKAFMDFVQSAEGESILRANGYMPGK